MIFFNKYWRESLKIQFLRWVSMRFNVVIITASQKPKPTESKPIGWIPCE